MSGGGLALPPAGGGVSDATAALRRRARSTAPARPRSSRPRWLTPPGGPGPLPARAVLTALLCLVLDDRPLFLTEATRLLFCELSKASRRLLGVPGTVSGDQAFLAAYRRVRYCFRQICSVDGPLAAAEEPPPDRAGPQSPHQEDDPGPGRGRPGTGWRRWPTRCWRLASPSLTEEERAAFDGCTGLDATPVPLFSRGPSRRSRPVRPATPTAAGTSAKAITASTRTTRAGLWGRSAGRWRPPSPPLPGRPARRPPRRTSRSAWPWPGPAKTPAAPAPGSWPPWPPAATSPAGSATTAPIPRPCPNASTSPPARSATTRSWTTATTSSASRRTASGALLVEGTWYCPALPGPLITATTGLRDHAITRDLYGQQIAARACYQLKRKDGPDADGYQRLSCPAAGQHPGLICPLRQASLSPRDGRAKVLQPPHEPPRICRQTAITIAPDTGARYRQDLPYGSPAWHKSLRHLAEHHRRPQRLRQRPRP